MKKFEYQVLRYIHDYATSEFVNVGVVIFSKDENYLNWNFTNKYSRISQFFGDIAGTYISRSLRYIEKNLKKQQSEFDSLFEIKKFSIVDFTSSALQVDNSSLIFSEVKLGIDLDLECATYDLFEALVNLYIEETNEESKTDAYAWKKVYKTYFDKYRITSKLKAHTVETKNDSIKFDKAWKNGSWNCFESLSLDLKNIDAIKNKAYKWNGILDAIGGSSEKTHIYFMTIINKSMSSDLKKFVFHTLKKQSSKVEVTIITQDEAEDFTKKLKEQIDAHDSEIEDPF